jgi:maleylacetoacetate isomerase
MTLTLHSMWAATAPYRVRIGLAIKGLAYDTIAVNLTAGEQADPAYAAVNPLRLIPTLTDGDLLLTQSLAILEWLEETHRLPPLLPKAPADRAAVRAMAEIVACDIHPVNNLRIRRALDALGHPLGGPEQTAWGARWINDGFAALEPLVARHGRGFAFGDVPTIADCCLIPQIWSSARFGVSIAAYPALAAVFANAAVHPAFIAAHPDQQPDKPSA